MTRTIYLFDDFGNKIPVGSYAPNAASLSVSGDWTNTQYVSTTPDITGLIFTCTFSDGNSSTITDVTVTPTTWSSTAGIQTATFSYTSGEVTVTAIKDADVE